MDKKASNCIFCNISPDRVLIENELSLAFYDAYPVTELHTLIIPKRHFANYFDSTKDEIMAFNSILHQLQDDIRREDSLVKGFNVGVNCGEVAGQTIFHCHIHLIPRRKGDVEDPRGGIRHLIPGKGYY